MMLERKRALVFAVLLALAPLATACSETEGEALPDVSAGAALTAGEDAAAEASRVEVERAVSVALRARVASSLSTPFRRKSRSVRATKCRVFASASATSIAAIRS